MKGWLTAGVLGVVLFLPGVAAAAEWHADYDKARALARASGRPMFLVFRCVP